MTSWDKWIEQQIQKAIEEGAFENLPGMGQPLNLEDDALLDPDWRLAYRLLRSNGFTLPWIESRREIELQIKTAREALARAWVWRQAQGAADMDIPTGIQDWTQDVALFRQRVEVINHLIADYNLQAPALSLQLVSLDPEREMDALTRGRPEPGTD